VEGAGNRLMLSSNPLETIRSACPSHGRGRRFNPCSAHHCKCLLSITKFLQRALRPRSAPMFRPKKFTLTATTFLAICRGSSALQGLTDARRWLRPASAGCLKWWKLSQEAAPKTKGPDIARRGLGCRVVERQQFASCIASNSRRQKAPAWVWGVS
jgi:hypothetical protein